MCSKAKKGIHLASCIISAVLAVVIAVFSFLPVATFDTDAYPMSEAYTNGRYTSHLAPDSFSFSLGHAITFGIHAEDMIRLMTIQEYEWEIEEDRREITLLQAERDLAVQNKENTAILDAKIADKEVHIATTEEKLVDYLATLPADYGTGIQSMLSSTACRNAIAMFYGFEGYVTHLSDSYKTSESYGIAYILAAFISLLGLIVLATMSLIYALIAFISAIILLVRFFRHVKHLDTAKVDSLQSPLLFPVCSMGLLTVALIVTVTGGVSLGYGFIVLLVAWVMSALLRCADRILSDEKLDVTAIVKQSITAFSAIALTLALVGFTATGLVCAYNADVHAFMQTYAATLHEAAGEGVAISTVAIANTLSIYGIAILAIFTVVSSLACTLQRLGYQTYVTKKNPAKPYGARYVSAALLLICAVCFLIPTTADAAVADEAFKSGQYLAFTDREGYSLVDGAVLALVGAILFLLSEIAYKVVPHVLNRHKATETPAPVAEVAPVEEIPAVEAPAEEAPVEEIPAVEAPAEEVPVEEVPTEEISVEEVPVDEIPVEEIPVEEIPVEEVPVEEVPVEEIPVEEVPVEEVPVEEVPVEEIPVEE